MSNEKVSLKNNKRKKKMENDQAILESLAETHIFFTKKASNKFPRAKFVCKICPYHMDDIDKAVKHSNDNMHNKNLKKLSTKNLLTYLPQPTEIQYNAIDNCLENVLNQNHFISSEESERRIGLCQEMNKLAYEINQGNQLVIHGSILTGLSLKSVSNVNLFFGIQTTDSKRTEYLSQMKEMQKLFKTKLNLKTKINLEKNNCGLFCIDKLNVSYHISPSCRMQMLSSELIKVYLKIDQRAEKLAKIFRYLANISFIDQVKDGLFPSDVFAIMVIFYLQQLQLPILPNLHKLAALNVNIPESVFSHVCVNDTVSTYINDINWIRKLWSPPNNAMTLAELWVGMLKFYLVEFNYSAFMVSISSLVPVLKINRNIVNKRLSVEDPFDQKKNLLFSWNSPDVIDFVNDQLQGCYIYFAIPQLSNGALFTKVSFQEIMIANMKPICIEIPTFNKDTIIDTVESLDPQFKCLYSDQKQFYDVTKWPIEIFVKSCCEKILMIIFSSSNDIKNLILLLELKIRNCFQVLRIDNYEKLKDYATKLAKYILEEFIDNFEKNSFELLANTFEPSAALEMLKKSTQRFVNESLNITNNDDCEEMDEMLECDLNGMEEATIEKGDEEFALEEVEEINSNEFSIEEQFNGVEEHVQTGIQNSEAWKLPIMFKSIYSTIKGVAISSDDQNEYNEFSVKNLNKNDLVYDFSKMVIHNQKLIINCSLCNTKGHRKENCHYAVPRFEELQDILKNVDQNWLSKLRKILNDKCKDIVQTEDRAKQTDKIFEKISEIIKSLYPTARPQMFGSTISGFKTRASDMDICLEFYENGINQSFHSKEVTTRLKIIGREIKKLPVVHRVDYILRAKVPIIKFYTRNNVHGDISINNSLGIQNTKMLKRYAEIGNGVKFLGNLIKYMTKACEIGDASMGTLSSYAYMLMLIHFLQKRGVLPILQELYEGERPSLIINGWDAWYQTDMAITYKLWNKKQTIPDIEYLWLDFFYYYAVEFDFDKEVVTIKQSDPLYKIDKNWQSAYMAVEDPFNLSHNLCGSLCLDNCRYILECFAHVLRLHSDPINLSRPDNVHHLLLEPKSLQPRMCFNCNKPGHLAKDCIEQQSKRTPKKLNDCNNAKNAASVSALPTLNAPLQLRPSNIPNRYYLQSDVTEDVKFETSASCHIPLKTFKGDMHVYSVLPLSMKFEDQTVIVPMLVAQNELIEKKLDNILKTNSKNVVMFPTNIGEGKKPVPHTPQSLMNAFDNFPNNIPSKNIVARRSPNQQSPAGNYNRTNVPEQMFNRNMMMNQPQRIMNRYRFDMMSNSLNNSTIYSNFNISSGFNQHFQGPSDTIRPYHLHHQNWNYPEMEYRNRTPMNNNSPHAVQRGNRK